MQEPKAYKINKTTASAELLFTRMGWQEMRMLKVQVTGRFFNISQPGADLAPISMN